MHGVLVHVDLGEHRVQVHERAADGDIEGQHRADLGVGAGEQVPGGGLDGVGAGPLGDTDGQGVLGEVQHVAALDIGVEVAVIVPGDQSLEVGVILKDIVGVQCLPAAGDRVHLVQQYAGAHAGEGIAGEVQVGHGSHHQIVQRGNQILKGVGEGLGAHLFEGDALHGLFHKGLALEIVIEILHTLVLPAAGPNVALHQPLVQEGLLNLRMQAQYLGHQVLQIDHLHAVVPEDLGEGVMLLLGHRQEGDVIKEQLRELIRSQIQKLPAGTMEQHLLQGLDLASYANTFHGSSFLF